MTTPTDPSQVADSVVTWSGFVLAGFSFLFTVFTAFLLLAGVFGLREIRNIRRTGEDVTRQAHGILTEAGELLGRLRAEMDGIDGRMNAMVEVSYLFNQGEQAYRDGAYAKAVDYLGRAAELDPKNPRVLYRLGRSLTNVGDEAAAARWLAEMQALGGHPGGAERGLALVYRYRDAGRALRYARQAVAAVPNYSNYNVLGLLLRDSGNLKGSFAAHEAAENAGGESAVTPFYLALLLARQGATQRAVEESRSAFYRVQRQRKLSPVKSLWAELVVWARDILAGDYGAADALTVVLVESCTSRRRAREIGGHIDFLLRALGREELLDRYLGPVEQKWPPQPGE